MCSQGIACIRRHGVLNKQGFIVLVLMQSQDVSQGVSLSPEEDCTILNACFPWRMHLMALAMSSLGSVIADDAAERPATARASP
jgi:hypothetical protein